MATNSNVINNRQIGKNVKRNGHVVETPRNLTQRKAVTTVSAPADIRTGYLSNTTQSVTAPANVFGIEFTLQHNFENFKGKGKFKNRPRKSRGE
jgi:hypothetical protein